MKKRKGLSGGTLFGILAVIGLVVVGGFQLSATSGEGPTEVKDSTLNLAASQLGSSSKISTTAYATFSDGTVVTKSLSAGQFTSWSIFTNQDSGVKLQAFDSSNYPIVSTIAFDGSTQLNKVIKTAKIASASDVSLEARETSGASDNDDTLKIAAGGQATISSLRASVDKQDVYWNAGMVMVDTPADTNVTVTMPNAQAVAVPDSAPSAVDKAWRTYSPSEGENSFEEFAVYDSSQIVVNGDDSNDPAETLTFYADDVQAYQNSDTGAIEYGVTDNSGTGLGLAEQSLSVTVN